MSVCATVLWPRAGGGGGRGRRRQQPVESNGATLARRRPARDDGVLIELRDVAKSFGGKVILDGVSFKIYRGEAVGIIGASGTGKSTALKILAGLLAPDSGEVLIKGKPRIGLPADHEHHEDEHLRISMVFQNSALFDSLTVSENVGFLLHEHSHLPKDVIEEQVATSLARVGLKGVDGELFPAQLSGGMRKRVALARAVVGESKEGDEQVIMYDEPTAGLDPVASTVVEDLIRDLHSPRGQNGATRPGTGISSYIVVTHQYSTIQRAVDRIIFLHKGRVAWQGSVKEFNSSEDEIVRQFATGKLDGPIRYS
eukprot:evm.model.scf_565.10 EVM.evm.TU.scf_565.10   scf_565:68043-71574(+)